MRVRDRGEEALHILLSSSLLFSSLVLLAGDGAWSVEVEDRARLRLALGSWSHRRIRGRMNSSDSEVSSLHP